MIKITLDNPTNTKGLHFNHFKTTLPIMLQKEIVKAKCKPKHKIDSKLISFLEFLEDNLKTILIGERKELAKLISDIEEDHYISIKKFTDLEKERVKEADGRKKTDFPKNIKTFLKGNILNKHIDARKIKSYDDYKKALEELKKRFEGYGEILEKIFDYNDFTQATTGWSGYELASHLNVGVCPYCNRSFTTTLRRVKGQGKQTRPDYDHYYLKSRYEYLSLSLYNLIPSCAICNRTFKGEVDFYEEEAIHPYDEEFLEVASFSTDFDYTNDNSYEFLLGKTSSFNITFNIDTDNDELRKKVEKSIKEFSLIELYNSHKDIVVGIIKLSRVSTDKRYKELFKQAGYLFESEEEFKQTFFSNYMTPKNLGKRPLAKLTQDISNELDLALKIK